MTPVTRLHPAIPLLRFDRAVVRLGYATEAVDVLAVASDGTLLVRRETGDTDLCPPEAAIRVLIPGPERRSAQPFGAAS